MEDYIAIYNDRKWEDSVCFCHLFEKAKKLPLAWTEKQQKENREKVVREFKKKTKQILFLNLENGWDKLIQEIKQEYPNLCVKVICTTLDSLLYDEEERKHFFRLLELNKSGIVDMIAFLRKGQYELYQSLGYHCYYLMENYEIINKNDRNLEKREEELMQIGVYPFSYEWNQNIFNQLCVAKMLDHARLRYNSLEPRMDDFINTMKISSQKVELKGKSMQEIEAEFENSDVILSCSFTQSFHFTFFLSMELGIPCLTGNHLDYLPQELADYLVTEAEDNPIYNAQKVMNCYQNREKIRNLYQEWKEIYNKKAKENKEKFLQIK